MAGGITGNCKSSKSWFGSTPPPGSRLHMAVARLQATTVADNRRQMLHFHYVSSLAGDAKRDRPLTGQERGNVAIRHRNFLT
jgi:hypothetical protein